MESFIHRIIKNSRFVLAAIVIISMLAGAIVTQGVFATSIGKLLLGESEQWERYLSRIRAFASDEVFIISYHSEHLLAAETLQKLKRVVEKIEAMKEVRRVDSLLRTERIQIENGVLTVEPYAELALKENAERKKLLEQLRSEAFADGLFIGKDGKNGAIVVELIPDTERAAEIGPKLVNTSLRYFEEEGFDPDRLHRVGLFAALSEVIHQSDFNIKTLFPFTCIIILLTVYLMFRKFWPMLITLAVSAIAVLWSLAFAILLDPNINIFISMVPAVVLIVATSDVIHLCSAYMLELGHGEKKKEAIMKSTADVGKACLLTSATTFFGFLALSFVPTPAFRQLGIVLGFGVAVALLLAMTLAPILFSMMKAPSPWGQDRHRTQDALSSVLRVMERASVHHPRLMFGFWLTVLAIAVYGAFQMHFETDLIERFDKENRARMDNEFFHEHFAGSTYLDVFIDAEKKKGLYDANTVAAIARLKTRIEAFDEVDKAVSYVDIIAQIHKRLHPHLDWRPTEPLTRPMIAQYMLLFEMGGGSKLDRLINRERSSARVAVRLNDSGMRSAYATGVKIRALANRELGDGVTATTTGAFYLMGQWLDSILEGQKRGLAFAFVTIAILMMIGLRSFTAGMWSMIPNALPLLVLAGYVGLAWERIDSDTLALAMIAIGIGVDDTIHFLMRFRIERRRLNVEEALHKTYAFTGRAIIITTLILGLGFLPFAVSEYFSMHIMGTLLPMTLVVALMADLLLVPAMAKLKILRLDSER